MEVKLFYGSTTGNTEKCAKKIAAELGSVLAESKDIKRSSVDDFDFVDGFVLGLSTVDEGLLQEDFRRFWDDIEDVDFEGKVVALFGLGDQVKYGKWFVDGIGIVHDKLAELGAKMVGYTPTAGFTFESSKAVRGDQFVGLVLDEDNQSDQTDARIKAWCDQIRPHFTD